MSHLGIPIRTHPGPGDLLPAVTGDTRVTFTLLGPLAVRKDGLDVTPTAPKILQLLAMLVLRPGKIVQLDSIIEELWASAPPRRVRTTVQTYVYQIRRCIEMNGLAPDPEALLATRPAGYMFHIEPEQVDVFTFRQLCRQGRELLDGKQYAESSVAFRAALDLWSGPALVDVNCGSVLSAYAIDLQEQHRAAQHLRMEAEIEGGLHRELIGELRSLTAANPFDEILHGQLMRVLTLNGRRTDAAVIYRELRERLAAELGVDPCDELQQLHHDLRSAGPAAA